MKKLLIVGGSGFIGRSLISYYQNNYQIFVIGRNEEKLWSLPKNIIPIICDIRDFDRLNYVISSIQPDFAVLAAALKQIPYCEIYPEECYKTNIAGINNCIKALSSLGDSCRTLFISTDKACEPITVYGYSKAIAERLVIQHAKLTNQFFNVVRYGNVLNSTGSVIPLFRNLLHTDKPLPVPDKEMTHFFMSEKQAVELINFALFKGNPGCLYSVKLPSFRIIDLAKIYAEKYKKDIEIIGIREKEKIHEKLLSDEEIKFLNVRGRYLEVNFDSPPVKRCLALSSDACLQSKAQLETLLMELDLL